MADIDRFEKTFDAREAQALEERTDIALSRVIAGYPALASWLYEQAALARSAGLIFSYQMSGEPGLLSRAFDVKVLQSLRRGARCGGHRAKKVVRASGCDDWYVEYSCFRKVWKVWASPERAWNTRWTLRLNNGG